MIVVIYQYTRHLRRQNSASESRKHIKNPLTSCYFPFYASGEDKELIRTRMHLKTTKVCNVWWKRSLVLCYYPILKPGKPQWVYVVKLIILSDRWVTEWGLFRPNERASCNISARNLRFVFYLITPYHWPIRQHRQILFKTQPGVTGSLCVWHDISVCHVNIPFKMEMKAKRWKRCPWLNNVVTNREHLHH